jgi:hypothetical protein
MVPDDQENGRGLRTQLETVLHEQSWAGRCWNRHLKGGAQIQEHQSKTVQMEARRNGEDHEGRRGSAGLQTWLLVTVEKSRVSLLVIEGQVKDEERQLLELRVGK